ncbi:MAG: amidohydrolase family protein [Actinobacteria bacterium]|nr:amidohydrolase family protein [Actinomycetota bacterium]
MSRYLLRAGTVLAGDPPRPGPTAVLVEDDRIAWVGTDPRERPPGRLTRNVDLGPDAVVAPGFVDAHHHLASAAVLPGWVDLTDAVTATEVSARMRRAAGRAAEGLWAVGWGYRESVVGAGRPLRRADLDDAVPGRPAMAIHASGHSSVLNSAALAVVGFGRGTPRRRGGEVERNLRGEPNGRVWERAHWIVLWAATRAELDSLGAGGWGERVRAFCGELLAEGVTHVADAGMSPRELALARDADLPIGLTAMPIPEASRPSFLDEVLAGPATGEGDPDFRIGHLKLWADGAERCGLLLPYPVLLRALRGIAGAEDGPSPAEAIRAIRPRLTRHGVRTGMLHHRPEELAALASRAAARGFGVAIHALGNEAIRHAAAALERAGGGGGGRIEHAMFPERAEIETMARLGVTAVVQPAHLFAYGALVASTGLDSFLPPIPFRSFLDAGIPVALSSDAPTALWEPLEILRMAVDRRTEDGVVLRAEEAPTREEALRAQTAGAADAALVGEVKGRIRPGHRADLAVLTGDPFDPATRVRQTWVAGRLAFESAP